MSNLVAFELEQIVVSGTAREMGEQHGESLRQRVQEFVTVRLDAVEAYAVERGLASAAGILDIGQESMAIFQRWDPEGYEEHLGIARGAQIDPVSLYTATNMTDMRDALLLNTASKPSVDQEGCSALLIPAHKTANHRSIAGQTWDLNPPDIDYIVAIKRQPASGVETWSVTCAGCLTLMGINAQGLSVGTTNIKTFGSKPGVGYLATLHRMLRSDSVSAAAAVLGSAPRAGAHVFWMADPIELREYETTPEHLARRDANEDVVCHTNHCVHDVNQSVEAEAPGDSSQARLRVMSARLRQDLQSVSSVKDLFADRSEGVLSINRYPEDEQGTATNAVFISVPAERVAFACRGPADRGKWYELNFN